MFFWKNLNTLTSGGNRILAPKQWDRTWFCACVTRALKVVESCSKAQKMWQVFSSALDRNFKSYDLK